MVISKIKYSEALDIVRKYNGNNPMINKLKYLLQVRRNFTFTNFETEYVLYNYDFTPIKYNKVIKVTEWFAKKKQEEWNIDFLPTSLAISYIIGETENTYHCYVKYSKKQEKYQECFISKKAIMGELFVEDYESMEVDFDKYDFILSKHERKVKDHQKQAVKFLLTNPKSILGDSPGLGKTYSSIITSLESGFQRVLIICPASLKSNWQRELEFFVNENDITIIEGNEWIPNKRFTIINYDILSNFYKLPLVPKTNFVINPSTGKKEEIIVTKRVKDPITKKYKEEIQYRKSTKKEFVDQCIKESLLLQNNFDAIFIDEAHKLSNDKSQRYQVIYDFIKKSKIKTVHPITGTPITNRPMNYYHLLNLIDADITKDYNYYIRTFCNGRKMMISNREVWIAKGSSNLDELREKTKHLYIRRLQKDIPGMVEKNIVERYYKLTPTQKIDYDDVWNKYVEAKQNEGERVSSQHRELIEQTILRQFISLQMIPNTIELADSHLENDEKVIIMCAYDEEIDRLKEYYGSSCVIYKGGMTVKQKDKAEQEFMNNPNVKVFIGNIIAAGVGLNLHASHICIFNSYDWVPGNNDQAMDRIYRLVQVFDVTVYFQIFLKTVSEDMWNTVVKKTIMIDTVIKSEDEK